MSKLLLSTLEWPEMSSIDTEVTALERLLRRAKEANRAALIGYIPAGFPTIAGCKDAIDVLIAAGFDAVEIGYPYSDPVMDGPIIQEAADIALRNGVKAKDVLSTLNHASNQGAAAVVMTYWNPIEQFGAEAFAQAIAAAGGSGVITPDLSYEQAHPWKQNADQAGINTIFVVAPSTTEERLKKVTGISSGFIYAASLMGVTGTRAAVSNSARELVARIREVTDLPVAVGLGVSTPEQAREVAEYADGVIIGSALIKELLGVESTKGLKNLRALAESLVAATKGAR
jgi:tryptophan synthase alpha chain